MIARVSRGLIQTFHLNSRCEPLWLLVLARLSRLILFWRLARPADSLIALMYTRYPLPVQMCAQTKVEIRNGRCPRSAATCRLHVLIKLERVVNIRIVARFEMKNQDVINYFYLETRKLRQMLIKYCN